MVLMCAENSTLLKLIHPSKADISIFSTVLLIVMLSKDFFPLKAFAPIILTPSGITTFLSFPQYLIHSSPLIKNSIFFCIFILPPPDVLNYNTLIASFLGH